MTAPTQRRNFTNDQLRAIATRAQHWSRHELLTEDELKLDELMGDCAETMWGFACGLLAAPLALPGAPVPDMPGFRYVNPSWPVGDEPCVERTDDDDAASDQESEALAMLRDIEWVQVQPSYNGSPACPSCDSPQYFGHEVGCKLAALLERRK